MIFHISKAIPNVIPSDSHTLFKTLASLINETTNKGWYSSCPPLPPKSLESLAVWLVT